MSAPFALPENTAAELLAMRLVLAAYLAAPDGTRPVYHLTLPPPEPGSQPELRPLHVRAGLSDELGARMLAGWSNRRWWSPTPSYALGDPTDSGIVHFAKVVDAMTPDAWRAWWPHLTAGQVLELIPRLWKDGPEDLVALCFNCGAAWATVRPSWPEPCPMCEATPKRRDPGPRAPALEVKPRPVVQVGNRPRLALALLAACLPPPETKS